MLRHVHQHGGGVRLYTHYLLRRLLAMNCGHEFVLLYRDPTAVGTFVTPQNRAYVRELALAAPSTFLWDQLAVSRAVKREKLDLLFNPKYSIPLACDCPTVFVCHGLDWYVMPWASRWHDRLSHRYLVPRYAAKASAIIAVSETTRQHVMHFLNKPANQVHAVYLGVNELFRRPIPPYVLQAIRRRYALPHRFFLYVGQVYPPKNLGRLLQAYAAVGPQRGVHLVLAGEHRWLCERELKLIDKLNLQPWVRQTGWIDHDALPAFYKLAKALAMPSLYEACPSPILEAMATGCPIVTSDRFGTLDLAKDAATLVDPENVHSIAAGLQRVLDDPLACQQLVQRGYQRLRPFTWQRCAKQTLHVLETAAGQQPANLPIPRLAEKDNGPVAEKLA